MNQATQKRATKAISRARTNAKRRNNTHVVIQDGTSFHVVDLAMNRTTIAHQIAKACGCELIYVEQQPVKGK